MDDHEGSKPRQGHPLGIFDSLRQLLGTLAAIAQTRIELLGTEVEEQIARLISLLLWTIVSLFLAFTTVVLAAVAVLVAFWDTNRVLVAVLLAAGFAMLALISWFQVRAAVRDRPHLFQSTLTELARDRDHLEER
ncbi:MAG: phage holin family protein [Betaproteobacteria bacterium]